MYILEAIAKEQSKNKESQSQVKEILQERLDLYKVEIDENELNLRRNIILGGVFYFDMLQIPPQPKRIANWIICQLETPQVWWFIISHIFKYNMWYVKNNVHTPENFVSPLCLGT